VFFDFEGFIFSRSTNRQIFCTGAVKKETDV